MAKSTAAVKPSTPEAAARFEQFYRDLFDDRWPKLRAALLEQGPYERLQAKLRAPYFLDPASAAVARQLPLVPADPEERELRILDACAAPGGKTLVLAERLPDGAQLIANERSAARRARLHRVLAEHLDEELRSRIEVTGHDASKWGLYERNAYDAVLLDVPCSSERHVLQSPAHLGRWTPKRPKRLSVQAYAMLAAMIDAVKPGGHVLYVTCALNPMENDAVVAKAFRRRREVIEGMELSSAGGEPTEYGVRVLPDVAGGAGPLYAALLRKRSGPNL
jgi:16S rRNA C967 or C1407 C5-methylase (RsmB/RsmF family)